MKRPPTCSEINWKLKTSDPSLKENENNIQKDNNIWGAIKFAGNNVKVETIEKRDWWKSLTANYVK